MAMTILHKTMLGGLVAVLPVAALAQPVNGVMPGTRLTPWMVLQDAALPMQLLVALLVSGAIAAIVIAAMKLTRGGPIAGGSAYLSSLRLGAPLLGTFGVIWEAMNMFFSIAAAGATPPLAIMAPGIVEGLMILGAGFVTGMVAVICHWAVESRIDRDVLLA
jgi:hypothetical protein